MWALAAGIGLSAFGSVLGGSFGRSAAREQARRLQEQAAWARAEAAFRARRQAEADAQVLGQYRAGVAKAGVAFVGSAAQVYGESVRQAELTRLGIILAGELRARGLEAQAGLSRRAGDMAFLEGILGAGAAVVKGFGAFGATPTGGNTTLANPYSPVDL